MAISDKEFYAAHGIDYNPAKWLQGYTDYALIKMLEDVRSEIESASLINYPLPTRATDKLKLIGCMKGINIALDIIDKHILDLTSEVAANEKVSEESGEEPSMDV